MIIGSRFQAFHISRKNFHKNRIEKHLQQCGFKLSTILSDIFGMSGFELIKKLCAKGKLTQMDVEDCLHGTLRAKSVEVQHAVAGQLSTHDKVFLTNLVKVMETCQKEIEEAERHIENGAGQYEPNKTKRNTRERSRKALFLVSIYGVPSMLCTPPAVVEKFTILMYNNTQGNRYLRSFKK